MHFRLLLSLLACLLPVLLLPSCVVAVAPVHDRSATVTLVEKDHEATFSFAVHHDRDADGFDKPMGVRMYLRMKDYDSPMDLKLGTASASRNGGPLEPCTFGGRSYVVGDSRPASRADLVSGRVSGPNIFNALILCPAETIPPDRSKGYGDLGPLKRGRYHLNVTYTLNGKSYRQETDLKLSREVRVGAASIITLIAPWSAIGN